MSEPLALEECLDFAARLAALRETVVRAKPAGRLIAPEIAANLDLADHALHRAEDVARYEAAVRLPVPARPPISRRDEIAIR